MTDQARLNLCRAADAADDTLGYCRAAYWSDEHRNYLRTQAIESLRTAAAHLGYDLVEAQQVQEHDRLADLLDSTIGAKLMQERAADAIRKRGQGEIEVALIGPTTRAFYEAYEIILALPVPTEAEVLAAAMELPQIKALLDALAGCLPIIGDLVKESGRSVEYGEEDAFRRGEWFESGDLQKVEAAYAALAEGTPT